MLTRSSRREDCAREVMSIRCDGPQPRFTEANVADVAAERRIVFEQPDNAVWICAREEVPRGDDSCHLRLQIRLSHVKQLRCRRRRRDIGDQYTSAARPSESYEIAQVLVAQSQRHARHLIWRKPR